MSISSETRIAGPFTGTGLVSTYSFTFKVFSDDDIMVVEADTNDIESTLVLNTDYTVSLNADQDVSPGGSITLSAPLATNYRLVITSAIGNLQPLDLTNAGGFYPTVINDALDRACIQIQQLQESVDRSVKVPITSDIGPSNYLAEANAAMVGAQAAQAGAEAALDQFTDLYLGVKSSDPSTDNDGNALQEGALYFNSTSKRMRVYTGAEWDDATVSSNFTVDVFSGNGSQTEFTLSTAPGSKNNTNVTISGVYQQKATYTVSDSVITFTTAPPSGASNIEVVSALAVQINIPADQSVTTDKITDNAVTPAKMSRTGTAGQVLVSGGTDADPSYQDPTTVFASATETTAGVVELATAAEVQAGTDPAKVVTPAGLASFSKSLTSNGYQKLPGGLIIQWGIFASTGYLSTLTWPISFPNSVLTAGGMSIQGNDMASNLCSVNGTADFGLSTWSNINTGNACQYFFLAIGY